VKILHQRLVLTANHLVRLQMLLKSHHVLPTHLLVNWVHLQCWIGHVSQPPVISSMWHHVDYHSPVHRTDKRSRQYILDLCHLQRSNEVTKLNRTVPLISNNNTLHSAHPFYPVGLPLEVADKIYHSYFVIITSVSFCTFVLSTPIASIGRKHP